MSESLSHLCEHPFYHFEKFDVDLNQAISALQAEANYFGTSMINDSMVRQRYMHSVRAASDQILMEVRLKSLSPLEGAKQASHVRNQLLELNRKRSSQVGRAIAEKLKLNGKDLGQLLEHYGMSTYGRPFYDLSVAQQNKVAIKVIESAGRANTRVSAKAVRLGRLAKGVVIISVAASVYNVTQADDKTEALAAESGSFGGGLIGGAMGGAAAGFVCGPGAPICVTIGGFIGAIAGGLGAEYGISYFFQ